jgi:hypothetical protein
MRGIVIWVSPEDFSALIWCEDSRDIAVAKGTIAWRNPMHPVAVGDYVGFACRVVDGHRLCRDVHIITTALAPDLAEMILSSALPPAPMAAIAGGAAPGKGAVLAGGSGNRLLHLCPSRD